jgi:prepilin-type N-terminal cleavage/methylation domain-containing protein
MLTWPMRAHPAPARPGFTLVELLVSLTIAGVVFGLFAVFSARQQRVLSDLAGNAALAGQLSDAAAVLPIDLRAASAKSGDIREARDTALELRATIASAVVCDTTAAALVLPPSVPSTESVASDLRMIQPGDTAWLLSTTDSVDDWQPYAISSVRRARAGQCAAGGPVLDATTRSLMRTSVSLPTLASRSATVGTPMRVTRPVRYSLYRASDGGWYLGARQWNPPNVRFDIVQPVAGPFLAPATSVASGLRFAYHDSTGGVLPAPVADTRSIAAVRVVMRGQTRRVVRALGAAASTGKRTDSVALTVLLRNRR